MLVIKVRKFRCVPTFFCQRSWDEVAYSPFVKLYCAEVVQKEVIFGEFFPFDFKLVLFPNQVSEQWVGFGSAMAVEIICIHRIWAYYACDKARELRTRPGGPQG